MIDQLKGLTVSYRDYPLALLANQPREINVGGNYWQLISQTVNADITLEFDDKDRITRRAGSGGPSLYQRVRVTSTVDQSIVVSLGYTGGMPPYDRSPVTISTGAVTVNTGVPAINQPLADVTIPAGSLVQVSTANANRRALLITSMVANAGTIRIGDSSTSATQGLPIEPGSSASIDGTAALYVFNPQTSAITVALLDQRV